MKEIRGILEYDFQKRNRKRTNFEKELNVEKEKVTNIKNGF